MGADPLRARGVPHGGPAARGLSDASGAEGSAWHRAASPPAARADPAHAFAITAEEARYYLAGALLVLDNEQVAMVATDGHRLAWAQRKAALKLADAVRVLVPRKAITELARLIEEATSDETVSFQQGDGHLIFGIGGRTLASKQVEAQFPAFEKVIAVTGDKKVSVGREALQSAIRRVSLLSSDRGRAVKLGLEDV